MSHISSSDPSRWGVGKGGGVGRDTSMGFWVAGKVLVLDLGGDLDENTSLLSRTFAPPLFVWVMGHKNEKRLKNLIKHYHSK